MILTTTEQTNHTNIVIWKLSYDRYSVVIGLAEYPHENIYYVSETLSEAYQHWFNVDMLLRVAEQKENELCIIEEL